MGQPKSVPSRHRGRKQSKPVTANRLEKAALAYLERYAASAESLRRILLRRVERSARLHGTDREAGVEMVSTLVDRFVRSGLLDDDAYARLKTNSLSRRGYSTRRIRTYLMTKGIERETIAAAIQSLQEDDEDPDFAAAIRYARRRRIGPWRGEAQPQNRDRDLAALGRQGYSYDIARKIIDAETGEDLEALLSQQS